jgi:hypothetical protein
METSPFDLTPEQQGLLVSLARETGKPISALIAEALDELQEHVHGSRDHAEEDEHGEPPAPVPPRLRRPSLSGK